MKNVIYKIESKYNGKIYIGSAINPYKRKSSHFSLLKKGNHHSVILQNHYNKYGFEDLIFIIIEKNLHVENLIKLEQFYIDDLKPYFNVCKIAGSVKGRVHSQETKDKIRNSLKGIKHSDERKKNMGIGWIGVIKKPLTDQHKKNMSISSLGKNKKPQTKEHIEKRTKYLLGNNFAKGNEHKNKPIIQFKDGILIKEFKSLTQASIELNTSVSCICHCLNNRIKKHKGYEFKYK